MNCLHLFAEEMIQKALREGAFDNLEGAGKPLCLEDDSLVPEDCRIAYKILRNSGHIPPEVEAEKTIGSIVEMLGTCPDEQERYRQIRKLNWAVTKLNMQRRRPVDMEKHQLYYQKAVERISVPKRDAPPKD